MQRNVQFIVLHKMHAHTLFIRSVTTIRFISWNLHFGSRKCFALNQHMKSHLKLIEWIFAANIFHAFIWNEFVFATLFSEMEVKGMICDDGAIKLNEIENKCSPTNSCYRNESVSIFQC